MGNMYNIPVNILLADDDLDDQELFGEIILETNPQSKLNCFDNGEKLMNFLKNQRSFIPHLIFLDINMPLKNGKECLIEIREKVHLRQTPVIIFTTSLDERDVKETYKNGANLFISKPERYSTQLEIFRKVFFLYFNNLLFNRSINDYLLIPMRRTGT